MQRADNPTDQDRSQGGNNSNNSRNMGRDDSRNRDQDQNNSSNNREFARDDKDSRDSMMDEDTQENL